VLCPGPPTVSETAELPLLDLMDAAAYKQQKEAFVSGLNGTTVAELLLLVCPLPAGDINMT
jgi:hypothetical protein